MSPKTKTTITAALVLAALTVDALAQQRTIYGRDGKVMGRVTTDSQGSRTIHGADGPRDRSHVHLTFAQRFVLAAVRR